MSTTGWNAGSTAGLQPYAEVGSGEVALWRLELKLNDLGRETLAREHDADYWDSPIKMDAEERQAEAVHEGYYEGQYGDGPMGQSLERVLFSSATTRISSTARKFFGRRGARLELARAVLMHALQREPTRAQAEAFVARFKEVLDDAEGHGWTIPYSELQQWLRELGVRG